MRAMLVLIGLLASTQPTTKPIQAPAPDVSDPKVAARAFQSFINSGDAANVRNMSAGTDEQVAAAVAVADGALAEHRLSDAARAKFGDESAGILAKPDFKPLDFPLDDPALSANVVGDSATLTLPSRLKPVMSLIRIDGQWRVEISSIAFLSRNPSALAAVEDRSAQVETELSQEIAIGQYVTAEDAARAKSEKTLRAEGKIK